MITLEKITNGNKSLALYKLNANYYDIVHLKGNGDFSSYNFCNLADALNMFNKLSESF